MATRRLEYEFAHEAFKALAVTLAQRCGGELVARATAGTGDQAYWDYRITGEIITLHYEVMIGTMVFNARAEGRRVLEGLRPLLDVPDHPIREIRG